jgi:hypothetical protein
MTGSLHGEFIPQKLERFGDLKMKNIFIKCLGALVVMISNQAFAKLSLVKETTNLSISFCPKEVDLKINVNENSLDLVGSSFRLDQINGDRICRKQNSSSILGGMRCYKAVATRDANGITYEDQQCATDLFKFKCQPNATNADTLRIENSGKMILKLNTGGAQASVVTCEYDLSKSH